MVPASFTVLDSIPLTPNGKVDHGALARIELAAASPAHVPPRTATEKIVAAAWAEVLRSAAPAVEDNFFDAGGHSLAAAQLVARLQSAFGVTLGVRSLFERPTIAGLSALVDALALSSAPNIPEDPSAEREEFEF
jgi:acyl carrier protein